MSLTVNELIEAVRTQIDEDSTGDITDAHIVAALNRGLTSGYQQMTRTYVDPLIESTTLTLTTAGEIDIPVTAFEDRVLHVDQLISNVERRITPGTFSDFHEYSIGTSVTSTVTEIWAQIGRKIKFKPALAAGQIVQLWYVKDTEKLVKPQGRITRLGADYVVVDSYGSGLSTDSDELNSFFSIIDFNNGNVKWTGQVKNITGDLISHKTTPTRSTVLNRTVNSAFSEAAFTVAVDDYICEAAGTCIPYMPIVLQNFTIAYAVVEMYERLNYDSQMVRASLGHRAKELEKQWVGRPARTKIHLTSSQWSRGLTRNGNR